MPFVCERHDKREHLHKRRKLDNVTATTVPDMARHDSEDMGDDQWRLETDVAGKADEPQVHRKVEYAGEIVRTSSREELIECIKRGQRPTWVPNASFQALCEQEAALTAQRRMKENEKHNVSRPAATSIQSKNHNEQPPDTHEHGKEPYERPRSALHRGNFSDEELHSVEPWPYSIPRPGLAISTSHAIHASPPPWQNGSSRPTSLDAISYARVLTQLNPNLAPRRRAPSLGSSLSSSFVMRAPTSPLVHATSNRDLPFTGTELHSQPAHRDNSRRRTMPPNSFHSFSMSPLDVTPPNFSRPFGPTLRREGSMPTQGHQTRRSLSSFTYHPKSNPPTPLSRSRRPSFTSDSGSRRRTSMVGSFEESILRGRMSAPASRPFDFVAQIGVMGRGDCPSNLKCPAHVIVPFPAVFYSYPASTGARSVADDAPSPYVGTVDLYHNLNAVTLSNAKRPKRSPPTRQDNLLQANGQKGIGEAGAINASKLYIGGAYRVPQQGQLQIIIKNPNKTAVKLFLVPYDLQSMEPSTKTFVRQRSYSTGPIIDSILGEPSTKSGVSDPLENKHILRYLIHLKFCCPAKGRFYLYDDIRVVFANRVPDGKEKLRNEIQLPEPKFSPWKPTKPEQRSTASPSVPTAPRMNTFDFDTSRMFGDMEGFPEMDSPTALLSATRDQELAAFDSSPFFSRPGPSDWKEASREQPSRAFFDFPDVPCLQPATDTGSPPASTVSPVTGFTAATPLRGSPLSWRTSPRSSGSKRSFSPIQHEARDSLLSKQFKELLGQARSSRLPESAEQDPRSHPT